MITSLHSLSVEIIIMTINSLQKDTVLTNYQSTKFRLFQTERVSRRQFQMLQKW